MNRITEGIKKCEVLLTTKLNNGEVTLDKWKEMERTLDMDMQEYCMFQQYKSIASTDGTLSLEEAMTVYNYLGNTPEHFNKQSLPVKYVLTEVWESLLKKSAASRGATF